MDRDFTVIDNEKKEKEMINKPVRHTNPIVKKFVQFHSEKSSRFSVKDIFKVVHD